MIASRWIAGAMLAGLACAPVGAIAQDAMSVALSYQQTNLVSDISGKAKQTDGHLLNPWGITNVPGGPFWINDNNAGLATLYDGAGNIIPAMFTIAPPAGTTITAAPTGIVWNPTSKFLVPGTKLPSLFIFDTEDGTISAWAPNLPTNPTTTVLAVDNSKTGAVYKGLDLGVTAAGVFLYATNFRAGAIEAYDTNFAPANSKLLGTFSDPDIPSGFAPFGIRNIDGNLVVTYAEQDSAKHDNVDGAGLGYVDVFDTDGHLLQRLASMGVLNAPWGIALAPAGFGVLSNTILIGNFGDGRIHAFDPGGRFRGTLRTQFGEPFAEPGLWSLEFGGAANSTPRTLYFTAGIHNENHGLFGSLTPNSHDAQTAANQAP